MRNENQTGFNRGTSGAIARLGRLIGIALLLAGLAGAVPLAGQGTTPASRFAPQITGGVPPGTAGEWRWMSGSSTEGSGGGQSGVYGTEYMPLGTNVPGAREGAPSWIDSSGNLWLFGGYGYDKNANSGYLNDVWVFNPSNLQWAWMAGSSTLSGDGATAPATYPAALGETGVPGGRQGAVSWTDKSGHFWLFGGLNTGDLNDLWEFTPNLDATASGADQWTWMSGSSTTDAPGVYPATMGTFSADNVPGARQDAMTWTDTSGNLWLFGGEGYDSAGNFGDLNDVWEFSPSQGAHGEWAWIGGSSTVPPYSGQPGVYGELETLENGITPGGRYGALTWTDSFGNFWLYGGEGFDAVGNFGDLNDLWEFDPYTDPGQWAWWGGSTAISGSGWPGVYGVLGTPETENIPGARDEGASWIDSSNHLWLFGGNGVGASSSGFLNDLWAFDSSTNQWAWMSGSGTPFQAGVYSASPVTAGSTYVPGSRVFPTSWTDSSGNLWLFGGTGYDGNGNEGYLNDLWEYTPPTVPFGGARATETPQFSVASGAYTTTQTVSITDNTFGATIYYTSCTTSGCIPPTPTTTNSSVFNSDNPITISSGSETLEAIAIISGQPTSAVGTAVYTVTPPVATPTFNPPAGPVTSGQTVTIGDATLGAAIFYTTNGSAPTVTGTLALAPGPNTYEYTGPITVSSAETIEAIGTKYGYANSAVAIAAYTISPQIATPTFSPAPGTYWPSVQVTISDTSQADIYYTACSTAGCTPTTPTASSGTFYSGPITLSSSETIAAVAVNSPSTSAVATATYTIAEPVAATPTFSPAAGAYTSAQQVTISDTTPNAAIYYTTDGSMPSMQYSSVYVSGSPISVSSSETINAIAVASGYTNSAEGSATYTINIPAEVMDTETITVTDAVTPRAYSPITITPTPAAFNASSAAIGAAGLPYGPVTFTATGGTGPLVFSNNGSLPPGMGVGTLVPGSNTGELYGTPPAGSEGTYTFNVSASDSYGDPIGYLTGYTLTIEAPVATPTFSPAGGAYTSVQKVTIGDTTSGATIYYTTDGTTPTASSSVYFIGSPITVSSTETIEAMATAPGDAPSAVATAAYTINLNNPVPVISSLSPAIASAGGSQFTLTVNGSGFVPGSTVYWGTTALAPGTINIGGTQLTATVPAADIATAGITNVTVQTPAPGGGTSNAFQFEVDSAASGTTAIAATATVTPGAAVNLPVTLPSGSSNVTVTCLNLPAGATCSYDSATNAVTITTSATTPAGTYQVTVVFTVTEPGAGTGFILLPILLLPLVLLRRRLAARGVWGAACLGLILLAGAAAACTGIGCSGPGATHQVTSSGAVTLTVT